MRFCYFWEDWADSKRNIQTFLVNHVKIGVFFVLAALLVVSTGIAMAQEERVIGQEERITVETDDNHYEEGDTIVIFGSVGTIIPGAQVTLQIFIDDILIDIAQIKVAQEDKRYSHTIIAEGDQWNKDGDYVVRVLYGEGNINETLFSYSQTTEVLVTTDIHEVDAGRYGTFDVKYTIKGGTLEDITVDSQNLGIVVQIDATDEGFITMDLPREFIGAEKQSGRDEVFIVLIDDVDVGYEETIVETESRVITINFLPGDSRIDVIGTYVVPEFGAAVMIALVAGMAVTVLALRGRPVLALIR